ncbi:FAD-dependent monooxygenase [Paraburkholderia pallida]
MRRVRETATSKTGEVRCALLAGCDGGGSIVRESLGFSWEGLRAVGST